MKKTLWPVWVATLLQVGCATEAPPTLGPPTPVTGIRARAFDILVQRILADFDDVDHLKPAQAQHLLEAGARILDARPEAEYAVSHFPGSIQWDHDADLSGLEAQLPKAGPTLVYCSVGYRSALLARRLEDAGWNQVHNLYGGIFYWHNQGRPVYRGDKIVDEMHPYNALWGQWILRGKALRTTPSSPPLSGDSP